jgi:putative transposase
VARPPRIDIPGLPQHVTARGHNKSDCFRADFDRVVYLKYLREGLHYAQCDLHAYVLMTNHVHLLVTPRIERGVSSLMQQLGRRYCRFVNRIYARTGSLCEGRFRSNPVEAEAYFFECMRYIELNPVRAGMARHPSQYPWSSYAENVGGDPRGLLVPHPEYLRLGREPSVRSAAYRALLEEPLGAAALERIRRASSRNDVLGSKPFVAALESKLGRPVTTSDRGRPRKSAPEEKVI